MTGLDVHALQFRCLLVDKADRPAADRATTVARHKEGAAALLEMFCPEIRTEALRRRIEFGQAGVQFGHQASRIV